MLNRFKLSLVQTAELLRKTSFITFIASLLFGVATKTAAAQGVGPQEWSEGVCTSGGVATIQGLQCLLGNIFSIFIPLLGMIIFVMLIIGSFRFMLSGSNSKGKDVAKSTVTYAVIGLIVALSSFFILNLVAQFTGIDLILNFSIPNPDEGL